MKIYSILPFLFTFALSHLFAAPTPLKIDVSAKTAILMNAETGAVLWEKNASKQVFPGSTSKLITALYAMHKKGNALDEMVLVSPDAALYVPKNERRSPRGGHPPYRLEFGGTHMGIKPGEILSLRTLFYGMMLCSGNDASNVIAEYVSGSIPKFMDEMNHYVQKLGCKNTILYTPHGLTCDEHKTTAYDMAFLAREFLKNSFLREVVKSKEYLRHQTNLQPESMMKQFNALLKPGRFYYPKATGLKTGFTDAAGWTLVSSAQDENRSLIAVVLGCERMELRYSDSITLFEAAFNEVKVTRTLFSKGFDVFSHAIEGGKSPLQAYLPEDVILNYYPSEEPVFKTAVLWEDAALPVKEGQKVGTLKITAADGKILSSAPLFAAKAVDATLKYQINAAWCKAKSGLWNHLTLVMAGAGLLILASSYLYTRKKALKSHKAK